MRIEISTRNESTALLVGFLALVPLKLALVADEEVFAGQYDPEVYARTASSVVWLAQPFVQTYRQGFPFLAGVFSQFGIPYRLGIELLYLLSCLFFSFALQRIAGSRLLALLTFFFLAFHPWPIHFFRYFLSEPSHLCLALATLACWLLLASRKRVSLREPLLWLTGLLFGLWDWIRIETPLLVATHLAFVTVTALRLGVRQSARSVAVLLLPLLLLPVSHAGVASLNWLRKGSFGMSRLEGPGFKALMKALYRIEAPDPSRFIPVTLASLRLACDASPTLALHRATLLDPERLKARGYGVLYGRPGEPGPALTWDLLGLNPDLSAGESDLILGRAAAELEEALARGRLPSRTAFYPIDPNWRLWLPIVPGALVSYGQRLLDLPRWQARDGGADSVPVAEQHLFDLAAGRRRHLLVEEQVVLRARASSSRGAIELVTLEDGAGHVLDVAAPQLDTRQGSDGSAPGAAEREAEFALVGSLEKRTDLGLGFWRNGRVVARLDLEGTKLRPVAKIAQGEEESVRVSVTEASWLGAPAGRSLRRSLKEWWSQRYGALLGAALLAAVAVGAGRGLARGRGSALATCVAMLGAALALRLVFYALLTANFAWSPDRYVQCASPILAPLGFTAAALFGGSLRIAIRQARGRLAGLRGRRSPATSMARREPDGLA